MLPALSGDAWLMAFGGSFLLKVATLVGVLPSLAPASGRGGPSFLLGLPQFLFLKRDGFWRGLAWSAHRRLCSRPATFGRQLGVVRHVLCLISATTHRARRRRTEHSTQPVRRNQVIESRTHLVAHWSLSTQPAMGKVRSDRQYERRHRWAATRRGVWLAAGLEVTELADPYYAFQAAGLDVTIASIAGGPIPIDAGPWASSSSGTRRRSSCMIKRRSAR